MVLEWGAGATCLLGVADEEVACHANEAGFLRQLLPVHHGSPESGIKFSDQI